MNYNVPLEDQLNNLKKRWEAATYKYVKAYPDNKLGLDKTQYNRAVEQVSKTFNDISVLKANLDANIQSNKNTLEAKDNNIKSVKQTYSTSKTDLISKLGEHKAAIPLKIQKYDENSKSYIFTSYYTISLFTLCFFIYKQFKME